MKTLTKKAIVLASAIAVAGAFAACAATITVGDVTPPTQENRSVTVPFTTDLTGTDQVTILAYNTDLGATPAEGNIVFIDQVDKAELTSITFSLRDTDPDGNYKVLMGGSGVTTAGDKTFVLQAAGPTTGTIAGTVTSANDAVKPSIQITGDGVDETLMAAGDNTYSISVPVGTYTVLLTQKGHIRRSVYNVTVVAGEETAIPSTTLMSGDVNDDEAIEDSDFAELNASWYLSNGEDGYIDTTDFNGDEAVEDSDFALMNAYWYLDSSAYDN